MKNKSGASEVLNENFVYLILTLVFFAFLAGFLFIKSSPEALMVQKTAKQIALIIDTARPGTEIDINVQNIVDKSLKYKIETPILIDNSLNTVAIRLGEKSFFEYGFFNEVYVDYKIENGVLKLKII